MQGHKVMSNTGAYCTGIRAGPGGFLPMQPVGCVQIQVSVPKGELGNRFAGIF